MSERIVRNATSALKALLTRKIQVDCDGIPCFFHNVPLKKVKNWLLVESSLLVKPKKPWGWPTHLQIEPTNLCNLKCPLCPVTEGLKRPKGHMELDLFKRFIDEVSDYVFLIILWDWGEPFLNPAVYEMISYAKGKGIKLVSSTNGHVFAKGEHAKKVVSSGLDSLIFAVDGITQETYERYRKRGDLSTLVQGIQNVVEAKHSQGSKTPFVNFRFIPMKHNEQELPMLKDFARSLGVDVLTIKTLNPHCESVSEEDKEFIPEDTFYQRFKYNQEGERCRRKKNPCKALWNNPIIHWDGKISPCTYDPHDDYSVGDFANSNFEDIWWGASMKELRRLFRQDYQNLEQCTWCSYAFEGGTLSSETIVEFHFFNPPPSAK
jgi:radical SAM protein with 4Fe4S-binding SPASM domain